MGLVRKQAQGPVSTREEGRGGERLYQRIRVKGVKMDRDVKLENKIRKSLF